MLTADGRAIGLSSNSHLENYFWHCLTSWIRWLVVQGILIWERLYTEKHIQNHFLTFCPTCWFIRKHGDHIYGMGLIALHVLLDLSFSLLFYHNGAPLAIRPHSLKIYGRLLLYIFLLGTLHRALKFSQKFSSVYHIEVMRGWWNKLNEFMDEA